MNGGYIFTPITLIASLCLTLYCANLLIETKKKVGGSYSEIGQRTCGFYGRLGVDVSLAISQIGFTTAYIYFISSNLQTIFLNAFNVQVSQWVFGAFCVIMYTPLCWVRKIEKFNKTHIFADVMILVTLVSIIIYASVYASNNGWATDMKPINTKLFPDAIGFAIYSFEGVGIVIPLYEVCACPD